MAGSAKIYKLNRAERAWIENWIDNCHLRFVLMVLHGLNMLGAGAVTGLAGDSGSGVCWVELPLHRGGGCMTCKAMLRFIRALPLPKGVFQVRRC